MKDLKETVKLACGVEIPVIGYGTWQTPDGEEAISAVTAALEAGYRHIDTAAIYRNEASVGEAIRRSGVPREELFITTKVWNKCRSYELVMSAFERSTQKLGVDYLDLYLIHWPAGKKQYEDFNSVNLETWRAMRDLYKAGKVRAIGVSNFKPHHLMPLMECDVVPAVNQIEFHPGCLQSETLEYCRAHGITVQAWSPLGSGRVLSDENLARVAAKYGKSVAQICIRWCLQMGAVALPKSVNMRRIRENADVFDFNISDEDMNYINSLPPFGSSGLDPDEVDF